MSKNQEFETLAVQRVITIVSSRESIKFSFIKFCGKVATIQETYNKDRV